MSAKISAIVDILNQIPQILWSYQYNAEIWSSKRTPDVSVTIKERR